MSHRRRLAAAAGLTVLGVAAAHHAPVVTPTLHAQPVKHRKHARAAHREARFLAAPRPMVTPASRSEERTPVPDPTHTPTSPPESSNPTYGDVLDVTAYCWTGSRTASGVWPEKGMAAGNDWPFGTRLRVEGVGEVVITDRYGYGTQLDLFLGHYADCEHDAVMFGRRQLHVEVVR